MSDFNTLFWIIVALMVGGASLLVLAPLARRSKHGDDDALPFEQDIAVFKDQLSEIDRDLKRGVVNEVDAESARAEVSRRLLEASDKAEAARTGGSAGLGSAGLMGRRVTAIVALLLVPCIAAVFYLFYGNPNLPDQPLQARLEQRQQNLAQGNVGELVEQVETHLAANPDDLQGWTVVAPVYRRLGRFDDTVRAYENVVRLSGRDPVNLSDLGEAIVLSEQGVITGRADALFREALEQEPRAIRPRFFLAMGLNQDAKWVEATEAWRSLLADATPQSAWAPTATDQLNAALKELGQPPIRNLEMAGAISEMSPEEQREMITGMVEGLASKLADEPDNLPDWLRLIRSYVVLERRDDAVGALTSARNHFQGDEAARDALTQLAQALQLDNETTAGGTASDAN